MIDQQGKTPVSQAADSESGPSQLALGIGLRHGPWECVEVDATRTDPVGQARLLASWKAFWDRMTFECKPDVAHVRNAPTLDASSEARAIALRARHMHLLDDSCDKHPRVRGVHEHFMEDAALLEAAVAAGLPGTVYMFGRAVAPLPAGFPAAGVETVSLGMVPECRVGPEQDYWSNEAFARHAGRTFVECTMEMLPWVVMAHSERGLRTVFLKACEAKGGTWRYDIPETASVAELRADIVRVIGNTADLGGSFFVQPWLPFRREMRFFVVDHKVARAVPVRRSDTVLDGTPNLRLEPTSCEAHDGFPAETDRGRVASYARVARRVARDMRDHVVEHTPWRSGDYVIDIGETADGRHLPIELNTIVHAGRYACDPGFLLRRMVEGANRRLVASGPGRRTLPSRMSARVQSRPLRESSANVAAELLDDLLEAARSSAHWLARTEAARRAEGTDETDETGAVRVADLTDEHEEEIILALLGTTDELASLWGVEPVHLATGNAATISWKREPEGR